MNDAIVDALSGETVVYTNALATITRNVLVVRDGSSGARAILPIERVIGMRRVITTNPGLLVVSCGLFTIAAGSYASKQPLDITLPMAFVGSLFVMGYLGTRHTAVLFLLDDERIESVRGTFREATSVIRAVNRTRGSDLETNL